MMSNTKIVEPWEKILQTGEWYDPPWWREEDGLFKQEVVENAFAQLKEIFDTKWLLAERDRVVKETKKWIAEHKLEITSDSLLKFMADHLKESKNQVETYKNCLLSTCVPHPIFSILVHTRGSRAFQTLVRLGHNISIVKENGLWTDTFEKLKDTNNYSGAEFEITILAYLLQKGFKVEHGKEGQPDFKVSKNSKSLWVEVKQFELSKTNKTIESVNNFLTFQITQNLPDATPHSLHVELSEELLQLTQTKKQFNLLLNSLPQIAEQIKTKILEKLQNKKWGSHSIPRLCNFSISPMNQEAGHMGSITGFPISEISEIKKMFRSGGLVSDTLKKLNKVKGQGILIVRTPIPFNKEDVRKTIEVKMKRDSEKYYFLSFIILFFSFLSFPEGKMGKYIYLSIPIKNPNLETVTLSEQIIQEITSSLHGLNFENRS